MNVSLHSKTFCKRLLECPDGSLALLYKVRQIFCDGMDALITWQYYLFEEKKLFAERSLFALNDHHINIPLVVIFETHVLFMN